jgi:hypothetical protein
LRMRFLGEGYHGRLGLRVRLVMIERELPILGDSNEGSGVEVGSLESVARQGTSRREESQALRFPKMGRRVGS